MKTQLPYTKALFLLIISISFQGCSGGGSDTVPTTGSTGVPALKMYQGEHQTAYIDSNSNLYTNIFPKQLEAYGGAPLSGYTWSVATGTSLPFPGMIIDPLTGLVHGSVPPGTAVGSYNYKVVVSDGSTTYTSGDNGTLSAYINVVACNSNTGFGIDPSNCNYNRPIDAGQGTLFTIENGLVPFKAGNPVGYSLFITGGVPPYKNWAVASGSLPPGLTIDQARGVLRGTPFSSAAGNTYTFTVMVSDTTNATFPGPSDSPATYKITLQ